MGATAERPDNATPPGDSAMAKKDQQAHDAAKKDLKEAGDCPASRGVGAEGADRSSIGHG